MSKIAVISEKIRQITKMKIFWALLLFLASMNFMAKYFYFVFAAFIVCMMASKLKCIINIPIIFLSVLSVCFIFQEIRNGSSFIVILKYLAYPMSYIIGYYFINTKSNGLLANKETSFRLILYSMTLGNFVHILLNFASNFGSITRNTIDFWSKSYLSATSQAGLFCLIIGVCVAMLLSDCTTRTKILIVTGLVTVMLYNLILSCRSVFLMLIIVLLVAFFYLLKQNNIKNKSRYLMFLLFAVFLFIVAFSFNLFDLQTTIFESNFFARIFGEENLGMTDTRFSKKIVFIKELWRYPFGGSHLKESYGYAHDIFLDTWDAVGIIGFLMIVFFIVYTTLALLNLLKNKNISFKIRQLALCVYIVLAIEFCIEPILIGSQWLFSLFCVICGAIDALNYHRDNSLNKRKLNGVNNR